MPATILPTVDTERLTLRGHRLEDFEESFAMWGNPEVTRYIGGKPSTREEGWSRLLRYVGQWDFRRDIQPSFEGAREAGWALVSEVHGKGYATEAVRAMLAWADGRFGPERLVCLIDPENAASVKVADRCGFRQFAIGTYKGGPTRLFERVPGARRATRLEGPAPSLPRLPLEPDLLRAFVVVETHILGEVPRRGFRLTRRGGRGGPSPATAARPRGRCRPGRRPPHSLRDSAGLPKQVRRKRARGLRQRPGRSG